MSDEMAPRERRIDLRSIALWIAVCLVAPGILPSGHAAAQGLVPTPALEEEAVADPVAPAEITARRTALKADLEAVERDLAAAGGSPDRLHLEEARERLRSIEGLLERQSILVAETQEEERSAEPAAAAEPSAFALNALYERQYQLEQAARRDAEALAAERKALASAQAKFEEAEQKRREARRELEDTKDPAEKREAEHNLKLRQLASRIAQERMYLRTLETRVAKARQEAVEESSEVAAQIVSVRAALARGETGSGADMAALSQREGELRRSRDADQRRLATAELRLDAAQKRFSEQSDPPVGLLEEIEALTARRDAIRQQIALVDAQLERLATQRTLWERWEAALRGQTEREELEAWIEEASERLEVLDRMALQGEGSVSDLRARLDGLQARLARTSADARVRDALEEQRSALSELLDRQLAESAELGEDRRSSARLLAELKQQAGQTDLLGLASRALGTIPNVWGYEITAVDDESITVGSVVLALTLIGMGLWASRRGSAFVGRMATDRLRIDAGAAHAFQSLSFYALLVMFTLLALRAIHFPLTAFTVLGGALAIGIGFGSQNVMNNFISGLILMLERPVRARDVVEVEGRHGTVERIGARSTQIRSTDGRHLVVPNSFFLESNVVNWTLSDELIRAKVSVGVIYGSPTRLVEKLIRSVVDEDSQVMRRPEPLVIFEEFGDNALQFDVYFWVRARSPMEVRKVQSRVRFRIDDLFREHTLVIAFPQRDIHLDTASPLEVRVMAGDEDPQPSPTPEKA